MRQSLVKNRKNLGFLLVIVTSLCYGTMPAVSQKCYELGLSMGTVLATRYFFGTILIWVFIFLAKRNIKISGKQLGFLLLLGVATFLCTNCMYIGYQYLPGAVASILVFLYIIYVNIIEVAIGREQIYRSRVICLVFIAVGILMVIYTPGDMEGFSIIGIIMAFFAGVFYAIMSMGMGAKKISNLSPEVIMGYTMLVPAVALIVKCFIAGEAVFPGEPQQWFWAMILAVGPGFLACVCFCAAIKIIGASTASMINTSEPVVAYFAGILIMSDKISWTATLGGAIVVIVILILNITERNRMEQLPVNNETIGDDRSK